MRRPFMLPVSRVSSHGANAAALFIARRGFFSATRIALACRVDECQTTITCDRLGELVDGNKELEKNLCAARSVMVKMNVLLQKAWHNGSLEIPVKLSAAIAEEMKKQRKHRLEDHQAEIKAAEEELATIPKRMFFVSGEYKTNSLGDWNMRQIASAVCKPGDSVLTLRERQAELEKLLRELKAVDTNSDAFLDRDAVVHDCRKP